MDALADFSLLCSSSIAKNILECALLVQCGEVLPRTPREDATSWFIGNALLPFPSCYPIRVQKDVSNGHVPEAVLPGSWWRVIKLRPLLRSCLTLYSLNIRRFPKCIRFKQNWTFPAPHSSVSKSSLSLILAIRDCIRICHFMLTQWVWNAWYVLNL